MAARKAGTVSEETRRRLIESAAEIFERRGYDGTTVAEIARNAGLTSGAIYAHYRNKSDLLLSTIEREGAGEADVLGDPGPGPARAPGADPDPGADSGGSEDVGAGGGAPPIGDLARRIRRGRVDPREVLDVLELVVTRLGRRSRGRFKGAVLLEAVVASKRNPEVAEATRARIGRRERRIADVVRSAQAVGVVDADVSADALARYTTALTLGLVLVRSLDLEPPAPDEWADLMHRLVGVLRPAGGPTDE